MTKTSLIIKAICTSILLLLAFIPAKAETKFSTILKHENGLQVKVPQGCSKRTFEGHIEYFNQKGKGFKICLNNRNGPITILLIPRKNLPKQRMQQRKLTSGNKAFYQIKKVKNPGSGGPEYHLFAYRPLKQHFLVLQKMTFSEWGTPSFEKAWAAFELAKVYTE